MRAGCLALLLAGCGATASGPAAPSDACVAATRDARGAWAMLADVLGMEAPPAATAIDPVLVRLSEHVRAVRERPPDEIEAPTAMALSSAVMDAIDALPSGVPEGLRARADFAAEALLSDRTPGGSVRAARDAASALEAAFAAVDPEGAAARSGAQGRVRLQRRAQSAANGYEESPRAGDQRAARAEHLEVPLTEDAARTRAAAVDASRQARAACGFARGLTVPSI